MTAITYRRQRKAPPTTEELYAAAKERRLQQQLTLERFAQRQPAGTMTRAHFDALSPAEKMATVQSGVVVVDGER